MKRISLYILSIIAFSSCIDNVDVKELGIEPKMVLYCYLSPTFYTTQVFLSNSQNILSYESKVLGIITDAKVELSTNGKTWVKCSYDAKKERYILSKNDFPIREGQTYYIRAKAPSYKETIRASCSVPYYRNIDLEIDTIESFEFMISAIFKWKDYPGEDNYYSFTVYSRNKDFNGPNSDTQTYLLGYYLYDLQTESQVFSDEGKDGSVLSLESYLSNQQLDTMNADTVIFTFNQINKDLYLYEKALAKYYMQASMYGLVEPSLLYNNIENGYGLFTAFTFKTFQYDFTNHHFSEYVFPLKHKLQ